MLAVLRCAGLGAFEAPLTALGIATVDELNAVPNERLLGPEVGMRMLHVNKLRRALQQDAAPSSGAGGSGGDAAVAAVAAPPESPVSIASTEPASGVPDPAAQVRWVC